MSNVYCKVNTCKHRSRRRSKKQNRTGEWLYKCTKDNLVLIPSMGGDEELCDNTVDCLGYEEDNDEKSKI